MIMEVEKSHDLPSSSWKPKKAMVWIEGLNAGEPMVIPVRVQRPENQAEGRNLMSQLSSQVMGGESRGEKRGGE